MSNTGNKKPLSKRLIAIIICAVFLVSGILGFIVGVLATNGATKKAREIINLIDKYSAYTTDDVDADKVARGIVASVLKDDKFATYYSKEEYQIIEMEDEGSYQGLGISFYNTDLQQGKTGISKVVGNSPAYKAGLIDGDIILSAQILPNGEVKAFSDNLELYNFLATLESSVRVSFVVKREGVFDSKEIIVKKDFYTVSYLEYYDDEYHYYFESDSANVMQLKSEQKGKTELNGDVAYIKFDLFEGDCANQFYKMLQVMKTRGKTKLLLDLRNNGGGFMNMLTEIASYLINNNGQRRNTVAVANYKTGKSVNYKTSKNRFFSNIEKISVIANQNTASASECLIGALMYYGKSEFNGAEFSDKNLVLTYNSNRQNYSTYGKGIMQATYKLSSGGAFKLTTAFICQPDGTTCIHDIGITSSLSENCVSDENAIVRANEILG